MEPVPDRSALDVIPGFGMGKAQVFLRISGKPLLIPMQQGDLFSSSSHCFLLRGNQNRVHCLMPIAVTACKASHWVQQCCSMPWHMTLHWAWSTCFLPREHGVRGALMLGPCLAPCSFMVTDHAGHTSPQKEQLFTLLIHTLLPRLWYCLLSSPSESCAPAALSSARQGSWGGRVNSPPDSHLSEQRWPLGLPHNVSADKGYLFLLAWLLLFTSLWL